MSLFRGRLHLRPGASALSPLVHLSSNSFLKIGAPEPVLQTHICLDILGLSVVRWIDDTIIDEKRPWRWGEVGWNSGEAQLDPVGGINNWFSSCRPADRCCGSHPRASLVPNSFSGLGSAVGTQRLRVATTTVLSADIRSCNFSWTSTGFIRKSTPEVKSTGTSVRLKLRMIQTYLRKSSVESAGL